MHRRLLIAAIILAATLLCLRVPTVAADAIGLPNSTYSLFLDFVFGSATDGTATMTVGDAGVTEFHFTNNLGEWDCGPLDCEAFLSSPDLVLKNASDGFGINDQGPLFNFLQLDPTSFGHPVAICTFGCVDGIDFGTWSVVSVPEPASLSLLGLGALSLFLRRRCLS